MPTLDAPTAADDWEQAHAEWADAAPADSGAAPPAALPTPAEVAERFRELGEADPFL